jgi:ABC-type amino acid transport system permease subunit
MSASLVTGTLFAMLRVSPNGWVRIPVGVFIVVMWTIAGLRHWRHGILPGCHNLNNRAFQSYVIYRFVAVVYFVCCYGLSLIGQHLVERHDPASRASTEQLLPRPSSSA